MIERIKALCDLMPTGWELMGTLGKTEKEVIVWQTLKACVTNDAEYGTPFSFKGEKLERDESRLCENGTAYKQLLSSDFLREVWVDLPEGRKTVIQPTDRLLDYLEAHFAKKGKK